MKKLKTVGDFKGGDIVSGRYKDQNVYYDAVVLQSSNKSLYIEFEGDRLYLTDFYNLTKRTK
jgi:hypothetical protein